MADDTTPAANGAEAAALFARAAVRDEMSRIAALHFVAAQDRYEDHARARDPPKRSTVNGWLFEYRGAVSNAAWSFMDARTKNDGEETWKWRDSLHRSWRKFVLGAGMLMVPELRDEFAALNNEEDPILSGVTDEHQFHGRDVVNKLRYATEKSTYDVETIVNWYALVITPGNKWDPEEVQRRIRALLPRELHDLPRTPLPLAEVARAVAQHLIRGLDEAIAVTVGYPELLESGKASGVLVFNIMKKLELQLFLLALLMNNVRPSRSTENRLDWL